MTRVESTEVLFARFRSEADPAAFHAVFERTAPALAAFAEQLAIPRGEIDDLLQETYLAALRQAERFDPSRDLLQWLRGILRNEVLMQRRRAQRHRRARDHLRSHCAGEANDPLEQGEIRALVLDSMRQLPRHDRELLDLRFERCLTPSEIGRRLGRPASTVRTQLARAIDRLRDALPRTLTRLGGAWLVLHRRGRPAAGGGDAALRPGGRARPRRAFPWLRPLAGSVAVLAAAALLAVPAPTPADAAPRPVEPAEPSRVVTTAPPPLVSAAPANAALRRRSASMPRIAVAAAAPNRRTARLRVELSSGGQPATGVSFALQSYRRPCPTTPWDTFADQQAGITDEHGVAVFPHCPLGAVRLRFGGGDGSAVPEVNGDCTLAVTIDTTRVVRGHVFDEQDHPIQGAEIRWSDHAGRGRFPSLVGAHSDAGGAFELVLAGRTDAVRFWAEVAGTGSSASRRAASPQRTAVVLRVKRAFGRLRGRVLADGRPAPDAFVMVDPVRDRRRPARSVRTGPTGAFELRALRPGRYCVTALSARGGSAAVPVEIGLRDREVELALTAGGTVLGGVRRADGGPWGGVLVVTKPEYSASRWYPHGSLLGRLATSSESGEFRLTSVPPGATSLVAIDPATGRIVAHAALVIENGTTATWELRDDGRARGEMDSAGPLLRWLGPALARSQH